MDVCSGRFMSIFATAQPAAARLLETLEALRRREDGHAQVLEALVAVVEALVDAPLQPEHLEVELLLLLARAAQLVKGEDAPHICVAPQRGRIGAVAARGGVRQGLLH